MEGGSQGIGGSAIIELALVLSVLVFLLAAFVDFTRCFSISQSVSHISREAANSAFRRCSFLPQQAPSGGQTAADCLNEHAAALVFAVQRTSTPFSSNLQLHLSVYRWTGGNAVRIASASNGLATRIRADSPRFREIVREAGSATVAEVRVPVAAFFGQLEAIFPEELYEATIF